MGTKEIKEYLKQVAFFCLAVKYFFLFAGFFVMLLLFPFVGIVEAIVNKFPSVGELSYIDILVTICAFFAMYFLAFVFGIFKKLDKLNFFFALLIIITLTFLLIAIGKINILMTEDLYKYGLEYSYTMYALIPAFLVHRLILIVKKTPKK